MEINQGQEVVTSEAQKLGSVVEVRDECVIIETGHVFKAKHAIPLTFVHADDGMLRATVSKQIVLDSPKVDAGWDVDSVLLHYGLTGPFEVDPDPDGVESAETAGVRAGVEPAPHQRIRTLGEVEDPAAQGPAVRERQSNANDPTGTTANLK